MSGSHKYEEGKPQEVQEGNPKVYPPGPADLSFFDQEASTSTTFFPGAQGARKAQEPSAREASPAQHASGSMPTWEEVAQEEHKRHLQAVFEEASRLRKQDLARLTQEEALLKATVEYLQDFEKLPLEDQWHSFYRHLRRTQGTTHLWGLAMVTCAGLATVSGEALRVGRLAPFLGFFFIALFAYATFVAYKSLRASDEEAKCLEEDEAALFTGGKPQHYLEDLAYQKALLQEVQAEKKRLQEEEEAARKDFW